MDGLPKTVLIVDPADFVRSAVRNTLERRGYRTMEASGSREALEVFRKLAHEITLVLIDLTMPDRNGEEVLRELQSIAPSVKVLLSSDYNEIEAALRFSGMGLSGFLQKPYTAMRLTEGVRAIIG